MNLLKRKIITLHSDKYYNDKPQYAPLRPGCTQYFGSIGLKNLGDHGF